MTKMSDGLPLVRTKKPTVGDYFRSGSCTGEPQANALSCLNGGDLTVFTDVVNTGDAESRAQFPLPSDHWINRTIPDEDDRTLLELAIEKRLYDFADVLLQAGADPALFNTELGRAPVHVACEAGDAKILKLLFRDLSRKNVADVNAIEEDRGFTPLHICAADARRLDCLNFLLKQDGIDVDVASQGSQTTPLYLAITKAKSEAIIRALVESGADKETVCFGRSIRQLLKQHMPKVNIDSIAVVKNTKKNPKSLQRIIDLLSLPLDKNLAVRSRMGADLAKLLSQIDGQVLSDHRFAGGYTLLQILTERGFHDAVAALIKRSVDVNAVTDTAPLPPLLIAAANGDVPMIRLLVEEGGANASVTNGSTRENVLHVILKNGCDERYQACLEYVLNKPELNECLRKIINQRDWLKNTPMHYATQMWSQEVIRQFLEVGANIGMKNHFGDLPINAINSDTMESFLDDFCLQAKGDINHEDFSLTFNYSFLAPPLEDLPEENRANAVDPENQKLNSGLDSPRVALPETQLLWYMGQSKAHRHLLNHPVIASFLYLKWGRIRKDFNRNVRFYSLFVFMLTWYIFEKFGGKSIQAGDTHNGGETTTIPFFHVTYGITTAVLAAFVVKDVASDISEKMKNEKIRETQNVEVISSGRMFCMILLNNWVEAVYLAFMLAILLGGRHVEVVAISLFALTLVLILRECFQVTVSLKRYLLNPENWLEVILVTLTLILVVHEDEGVEPMKRLISAVAIVLSWAELITLIGKHPKLTRYNVYVVMFYKVMVTFIFFLCWYAFFIIAFGLAFYILLHKDSPSDPPPGEDDYVFFNSPWLALVKTSTMFVGELEFGDIPIDMQGGAITALSYIFFLVFVFLIVVVLMNLLNGLAVSDTGAIQKKAEIVSYISRVETISYTESILLGDPFNFLSNWPAIKWLKNLPSCSACSGLYRNKRLQKLFHRVTGATGILLFYNILPTKKLNLAPNMRRRDCNLCHVEMMDEAIIASAKEIILKQRRTSEEKTADEVIVALQQRIDDRMSELEKKLDAIMARLPTA